MTMKLFHLLTLVKMYGEKNNGKKVETKKKSENPFA